MLVTSTDIKFVLYGFAIDKAVDSAFFSLLHLSNIAIAASIRNLAGLSQPVASPDSHHYSIHNYLEEQVGEVISALSFSLILSYVCPDQLSNLLNFVDKALQPIRQLLPEIGGFSNEGVKFLYNDLYEVPHTLGHVWSSCIEPYYAVLWQEQDEQVLYQEALSELAEDFAFIVNYYQIALSHLTQLTSLS